MMIVKQTDQISAKLRRLAALLCMVLCVKGSNKESDHELFNFADNDNDLPTADWGYADDQFNQYCQSLLEGPEESFSADNSLQKPADPILFPPLPEFEPEMPAAIKEKETPLQTVAQPLPEPENARKRKLSHHTDTEEEEVEEEVEVEANEETETETKRRRELISTKRKEWRKAVPKDIFQNCTAESVEAVIKENIKGLEQLNQIHLKDLNNATQCQVSSLEFIAKVRDTLQAVVTGFGGRQAITEAEADMLQLITQAIDRYNTELEKRREFLDDAIEKWIPYYLARLHLLLKDLKMTLRILNGEVSVDALTVFSPGFCFSLSTYKVIATTIAKGLEDLQKGTKIEDMTRNAHVATNVNKMRDYKLLDPRRKETRPCTGRHLKYTLFSIVAPIFFYEHNRKNGTMNAKYSENEDFSSLFMEKTLKLLSQFKHLEGMSAMLQRTFATTTATACEENIAATIEEIRRTVRLSLEELEVVISLYSHVDKHVGGEKSSQLRTLLYVESIETYVLAQAQAGIEGLEHVLRILYRVMKAMAIEEKHPLINRPDNHFRATGVTRWQKILSERMHLIERQLIPLKRKYTK